MSLLKRTYSLPPETVEQFEHAVSSGQRSTMITQLLKSYLEEQRRAQLRSAVIEGCLEMAEVYLETERAYHPLEEEVERGNAAES